MKTQVTYNEGTVMKKQFINVFVRRNRKTFNLSILSFGLAEKLSIHQSLHSDWQKNFQSINPFVRIGRKILNSSILSFGLAEKLSIHQSLRSDWQKNSQFINPFTRIDRKMKIIHSSIKTLNP